MIKSNNGWRFKSSQINGDAPRTTGVGLVKVAAGGRRGIRRDVDGCGVGFDFWAGAALVETDR